MGWNLFKKKKPEKKYETIVPFKETGIKPNVCDVCLSPLDADTSWFVPLDIFYNSLEYKEYYIKTANKLFDIFQKNSDSPMADEQLKILKNSNEESFYFMKNRDNSEGSAVCNNCIHMFR